MQRLSWISGKSKQGDSYWGYWKIISKQRQWLLDIGKLRRVEAEGEKVRNKSPRFPISKLVLLAHHCRNYLWLQGGKDLFAWPFWPYYESKDLHRVAKSTIFMPKTTWITHWIVQFPTIPLSQALECHRVPFWGPFCFQLLFIQQRTKVHWQP